MNEFPIKYTAQIGTFTDEDLSKDKTAGGCDKLIIGTISDRDVFMASWSSVGPDGGPLDPNDLFKAWVMLGIGLISESKIPYASRQICEMVFERVKEKVIANGHQK